MKKHAFITIVAICVITIQTLGHAADCKSTDKLPVDNQVKIGKLSNGFTYYIRKNEKPEGRAHFRLVVRTGAIQEDDDQDGLAHFCEHMAFNGTKNFPKNKLVDYLQKSGVQFGADLNASTGMEQTMYELPIPVADDEFVESAFQILEDWAHNVSYDNDQIDGERGVILAEWRQRNNSNMRLYNEFRHDLFKNSKYEKRNIIGDTNIIRNFKHDVIKRYYKDWYRPDLMAFIAVGDFDLNKIEALIKKHFNRMVNPTNPRKYENYSIPFHKETLVSVGTDKELTNESIDVTFKFDEYDQKSAAGYREGIKRQLFDIMLGTRISEILQKPNPPFVGAYGSESSLFGNYRAYSLNVTTKPGSAKEGFDALLTEAIRVLQHGYIKSELDRAKQAFISSIEKAFNERKTRLHASYVREYTSNFTNEEPIPGIEFEMDFVKSCLPDITLDEVNSLAKYYFKKENTVITASIPDKQGVAVPKESELLAVFNSAFSKKTDPYIDTDSGKPLFAKKVKEGSITNEKQLSGIDAVELSLSNGAKVILKKTDFKDDEILFDAFSAGGTSVIENQDFISSLLATEIINNSGVADYDVAQLNKMLSGKIVRVFPYFTDLFECIGGTSSTKDLETLLQLVNLFFTDPRYDKESFSNYQEKLKAFLANSGNSPDRVFRDSVNATVYNHNSRKRPINMDILNDLNYDKAYAIYKDRYANAGDFTFVFVGDFDIAEFKSLIKKYIASLPAKSGKENWEDRNVNPISKSAVNKYQKGNEDRAHVRLAIPGDFQWSDANRYKLEAISEFIDIKMTEIIREEKSGVYSPSIYIESNKYPKPGFILHIDFVCEPSRVDELADATMEIVKNMLKSMDDETIDKIRKTHQRQREVALKNNNYWLRNISFYAKNNEDAKQIVDYDNIINKLDGKDLLKFAKSAIKTDRLIKVVNLPEKN